MQFVHVHDMVLRCSSQACTNLPVDPLSFLFNQINSFKLSKWTILKGL